MNPVRALHLPAYAGFFSGQFRKMLAYRTRYVTGIISYLVYVTTYYYLWRAVFLHRAPGAQIAGFTLDQIVTYVAISWIARSAYFNNVDRELAEQVQNGSIAVALSRPVSLQGTVVAGALGEGLFRFCFFTLPIGAVIFLLFPVAPPPSLLHAIAFVLSCALSQVILTHVNFLVGMCAFPLKNIDGVMRMKHYLIEILSGLLLPISLFPDWLQALSSWLPFQAIAFVPSSIWLGHARGGIGWLGDDPTQLIVHGLAVQAAWVAALALLCAFIWRRAARSLSVQGG
ncbi:MAG: daunorubicin ABC transporter permease [Myxococcales bacterium]|nr:daunorubicin ABC transporter permease [Myxococcales bacterium]